MFRRCSFADTFTGDTRAASHTKRCKQRRPEHARQPMMPSLVMKGSPVRIRASAFRKVFAYADFLCLRAEGPRRLVGPYWVRNSGPDVSRRVASRAIGRGLPGSPD